jgi:hypothetical protein
MRRAPAAALLLLFLQACGGGSNGPAPNPNPNPDPGAGNPCAGISSTALTAPADEALRAEKRLLIDGDSRYNVFDALALHRARQLRDEPRAPRSAAPTNTADIGEIAVIQDEGDIIAPANAFDLRNTGVRFTRSGSGYAATRIDGTFRQTLGRQLALGDDDSAAAPSAFGIPFYGVSQTAAFVNSDGNVTFGEEDRASTERTVARLATGPPRAAPFLADLDPSAGGRIYVNAAADQYTVTWCNVRGFDSARTISTQVTLLPDGSIDFKWIGTTSSLADAVVGISPGRTGDFTPVNLSEAGPNGGPAAIGERFAAEPELDTVALLQKFYRDHPDNYDQVVIWTDTSLIQDAFAYELTVKNGIRGIGQSLFDASGDFGSAGRLESFTMMDWISKYPDDPAQRVLGENSTLAVLAHETGHRWLALFEFRDHNGATSEQLLGRGASHWSFFFDSDASVMEGNDIDDLGGGSFRTVDAVRRYSRLDQYAMGLVPDSDVPSFFYVENPTNVTPSRTRESAPQTGVTFNGTRREVLIQDIIAINGPRSPSSSEAPRVHRQAFVFVVRAGRTPDPAHIARIDRIRREWEPFFRTATEERMQVVTTLR